eukprot:Lankesteria_metandrocarpae@DN8993_c0_g1_i1.p1
MAYDGRHFYESTVDIPGVIAGCGEFQKIQKVLDSLSGLVSFSWTPICLDGGDLHNVDDNVPNHVAKSDDTAGTHKGIVIAVGADRQKEEQSVGEVYVKPSGELVQYEKYR